ncbi:MAG: hypothetical protein AAFQ58_11420 [Pseudomonadota bacterium]
MQISPARLHFILLLAALALILPSTVLGQRFLLREIVVIPVYPIDANTFEVIENDGAGGTQLWCAAGKFTRGYLHQRGGDLTVLTPRAASATFPGRKSVVFTTRPTSNAFRSASQGVRQAGQTFSMAHAYTLCKSRYDLYIKLRVVRP